MKQFFISVYIWLDTIPERLYPFAHEIEGQWVRGKVAYAKVLEEGFALLGPGKMQPKLIIYRGAWHLLGSVVFIISVTLLARDVLGSEAALYILMGAAIAALIFQEFILDPRRYKQQTNKGIIDVFTWVVPMAVYIAFLVF
jgi:hypothetical protein